MHCGQTILSTAESQRVTHIKVTPRRKQKGTRELHEIIQYTQRKLCRSGSTEFHGVTTDTLPYRFSSSLRFFDWM